MSTLFVVATPIGNLSDLSDRARTILRGVPVVLAEDTRVTRVLLASIEAHPRIERFDRATTQRHIGLALDHLDRGDVALVSDAGTPGIADPGAELIAAAVGRGHRVSPIPGPSAVAAAVSVSPLVRGRFSFMGFPPTRAGERRTFLDEALASTVPVVLFEAPHRIIATLGDLAQRAPERAVTLGRELTKLHEELRHARLIDLVSEPPRAQGEFVLVIAAAAPPEAVEDPGGAARRTAAILAAEGMARSAIARALAAIHGLTRSQAYALAHETGQPD